MGINTWLHPNSLSILRFEQLSTINPSASSVILRQKERSRLCKFKEHFQEMATAVCCATWHRCVGRSQYSSELVRWNPEIEKGHIRVVWKKNIFKARIYKLSNFFRSSVKMPRYCFHWIIWYKFQLKQIHFVQDWIWTGWNKPSMFFFKKKRKRKA